jgi:hypothetical protein
MPLALGLLVVAVGLAVGIGAYAHAHPSAPPTFKGNVMSHGISVDYTLTPTTVQNVWRLTTIIPLTVPLTSLALDMASPPMLPSITDAKGWAESVISGYIVRKGAPA